MERPTEALSGAIGVDQCLKAGVDGGELSGELRGHTDVQSAHGTFTVSPYFSELQRKGRC